MTRNFDRVRAQQYMDLYTKFTSLQKSHGDLAAMVEALIDRPNDPALVALARRVLETAKGGSSHDV